MKILITGGGGMIGRKLADRLSQDGSSLDLSVGSAADEEEELDGMAPTTPIAQRSSSTDLFERRPTSLGESEVKRRLRLEQLCQKRQPGGPSRGGSSDDTASSNLQKLHTGKSLRNRRGSWDRWSLHKSTVVASSASRLSLRRASTTSATTAATLFIQAGTGSAHSGSTRWMDSSTIGGGADMSTIHGGSSHSPRMPQRTKSRDLPVLSLRPRPFASITTTAPRRPQRTISRETERELPSCASFALDDDNEADDADNDDVDEQIHKICKKVLSLTNDDNALSSRTMSPQQDEQATTTTTTTIRPVLWSQESVSSCTAHLTTKDLPNKIPRRQQSNEASVTTTATATTSCWVVHQSSSPTAVVEMGVSYC